MKDIKITIENTSNQWQEVNLTCNKNNAVIISKFEILPMHLEMIYIKKKSKHIYEDKLLTFVLRGTTHSITETKRMSFGEKSNTCVIAMQGYSLAINMEWKFDIAPLEVLDFRFSPIDAGYVQIIHNGTEKA